MQAATALIDFLMSLMRDDEVRTAFQLDPRGTLARHDLDGATGQDVRDACLVMADSGAISSRSQNWSSSTGDDPVREIHHTTTNYELRDQEFNYVNIEDNDTLINDSFNEDNDGVDYDSTDVVAIQDNDTVNNDVDVVDIDDSFNQTPAEDEPVTILPAEEPEILTEEPAIPEPVDTEPIVEEPAEDEPDLDPAIG